MMLGIMVGIALVVALSLGDSEGAWLSFAVLLGIGVLAYGS